MNFLEKDLEQIIYETDNLFLEQRGLNICGPKIRQLRIGNYGIADLITYNRTDCLGFKCLEIGVYELKQGKVGVETFMQAVRYCKGISDYLINHRNLSHDFYFSINLIGNSLEKGTSFLYLTDLILNDMPVNGTVSNINIYTYNYMYDGINFESHDSYKLTENGF